MRKHPMERARQFSKNSAAPLDTGPDKTCLRTFTRLIANPSRLRNVYGRICWFVTASVYRQSEASEVAAWGVTRGKRSITATSWPLSSTIRHSLIN